MQRPPKYHSFPVFVLSFIVIGCVLVVLGLEFGWVQFEFDERNTGTMLAENALSIKKNDMKLLETIGVAVDSADQENGEMKIENDFLKKRL